MGLGFVGVCVCGGMLGFYTGYIGLCRGKKRYIGALRGYASVQYTRFTGLSYMGDPAVRNTLSSITVLYFLGRPSILWGTTVSMSKGVCSKQEITMHVNA